MNSSVTTLPLSVEPVISQTVLSVEPTNIKHFSIPGDFPKELKDICKRSNLPFNVFSEAIARHLKITDPTELNAVAYLLERASHHSGYRGRPRNAEKTKEYVLNFTKYWKEFRNTLDDSQSNDLPKYVASHRYFPHERFVELIIAVDKVWDPKASQSQTDLLAARCIRKLCPDLAIVCETEKVPLTEQTVCGVLSFVDTLKHLNPNGRKGLADQIFDVGWQLVLDRSPAKHYLLGRRLFDRTYTPPRVITLETVEEENAFKQLRHAVPSTSRKIALSFLNAYNSLPTWAAAQELSVEEKKLEIARNQSTKMAKLLQAKQGSANPAWNTLIALRDTVWGILSNTLAVPLASLENLVLDANGNIEGATKKDVQKDLQRVDRPPHKISEQDAAIYCIWKSYLIARAEKQLLFSVGAHINKPPLLALVNGEKISTHVDADYPKHETLYANMLFPMIQTDFFSFLTTTLGIPPDAVLRLTVKDVTVLSASQKGLKRSENQGYLSQVTIRFGNTSPHQTLVLKRTNAGSIGVRGFVLADKFFAERNKLPNSTDPDGLLFRSSSGASLAELLSDETR